MEIGSPSMPPKKKGGSLAIGTAQTCAARPPKGADKAPVWPRKSTNSGRIVADSTAASAWCANASLNLRLGAACLPMHARPILLALKVQ